MRKDHILILQIEYRVFPLHVSCSLLLVGVLFCDLGHDVQFSIVTSCGSHVLDVAPLLNTCNDITLQISWPKQGNNWNI